VHGHVSSRTAGPQLRRGADTTGHAGHVEGTWSIQIHNTTISHGVSFKSKISSFNSYTSKHDNLYSSTRAARPVGGTRCGYYMGY
jgi:hypothetical protein